VLRNKARLFLALWPGPEVRAAMAQYRDTWRWPDKAAQVRAEKLHLTLHFIGDVERERLPELRQIHIPFEPFDLKLGYPDLWPHGIAVLRPHIVPAGLMQLQAALGSELQRLAVPFDAREFRPHVTLARRAGEAALPQQPAQIDWHVDGYVLVESEFDANRTYTVLARY
jgi:2'-5' RNA ligase